MPLDKDSILLTLGELVVPRIQIRPEVSGYPSCSCWCFSADWHSRFTPFLSPKAAWGLCTPNPLLLQSPIPRSLDVWDGDVLLLHLISSLSWSHPCSSQEREPFSVLFTAFWIRALQCQWCCRRTPWSSKNCPKFSACSAKSLNLGKYQRV